MNYTIKENISLSAYQCNVVFDESVNQYKINDDFQIVIYDKFNDDEIVIDKDNFNNYGLTDISGEMEYWEEDSFIKNKGLLIYFNNKNELYFKILSKCKDQNDKEIGYNTSVVSIFFSDEENRNIEFTAQTWPRMLRSNKIIQNDESEEDPILPGSNVRTIYDEELNETSGFDFDKDIILKEVNSNYSYNSTNTIYLNTYPKNKECKSVPMYINEISAFMTPDHNDFEYEINGSYLIDTSVGLSAEIPYEIEENKIAHLEFPIDINGTFQYNYTCDINYNLYTQKLISEEKEKQLKNKLYFGLEIKNKN